MSRLSLLRSMFILACVVGSAFVVSMHDDQPVQAERQEEALLESKGVSKLGFEELVNAYVAETNRVVIGTSCFMQNRGVEAIAPAAFDAISAETLLRVSLAQHKLVLVSRGDTDEVVNITEAKTFAPMTMPDRIGEFHPLEFISMVVQLEHAEAAHVRSALANFTTRNGGCVSPIQNGVNCLVISDFAKRVETMLELVNLIDQPSEGTTDE